MKQKLFIFLFLILLVGLLAGLNAVSYVQKEKTPDNNLSPNRSTFNSGSTGTQALYTLMSETGRKVIRWQEPPGALSIGQNSNIGVFVVIGALRREFSDDETEELLSWVSAGGRLVLIDRDPPSGLAVTTANWKITFDEPKKFADISFDPADQEQMTHSTAAIRPVQPTVITRGINAVQPSQFFSSIGFERFEDEKPPPPKTLQVPVNDDYDLESDLLYRSIAPIQAKKETGLQKGQTNQNFVIPSPKPVEPLSSLEEVVESPSLTAPVNHLTSGGKNLLVDAPFGEGRIIFLADPYIVSNGGIALVDNAQLAINMLAAGDHVVAFDEYHQGYGTNNNEFLTFFEGTPVVAMFFQFLILIGFVFFSQSRRFARAVPEPETDRLSKLEYVSAMAELQERTNAFDLAIENIYADFRRRVARLLGVDNYSAKHDDLAKLIAVRTGIAAGEVTGTLFKCEEIIRGEPTNKKEVLKLTAALRLLEKKLGMTRSGKVKI